MTSIRPAVDADMAAVADLWHVGWHDGHAGHVPEGLTAARTLGGVPRADARPGRRTRRWPSPTPASCSVS